MGKTKKVKGTKQTLEYQEAPFKWHVSNIKCKTDHQKEFLKLINSKEIVIAEGPAGVGKSYLALYAALKLLEKGEFNKITLVKSVTPLPEEELGALPGDIYEKMSPFLYSFIGNLDKLVGEETRKYLMKNKLIDIQPLAYVRGVNLDNQIVICDEIQNISTHTFKTIITRIGENSKYILMGDSLQIDLKKQDQSCLSKVMNLFKEDDLIGTISFDKSDCVRNKIIEHLLDKINEIE